MNKISKKISIIMLAFALAITTFIPMFGNEAYAEQGTSITSESEATSQVDNSTVLGNGKYDNTKFNVEFFGGTGKAKWSCDEINVRDGKAFAKFKISSKNYSHAFTGYAKGSDDPDMSEYYDPDTDKILKDSVYKIENKTVEIPVNLNKKTHFAGRSVGMTDPHWIRYAYEITIEEKAPIDQYQSINHTGMFKVVDSYITTEGDKEFMNITLSGEGYGYVFKGKYEEAVATGTDTTKWIPHTVRDDSKKVTYTDKSGKKIETEVKGKFEYKVPLNKNDKFIPMMAYSTAKKIWFPRYMEIDREKKELHTGDYFENKALKLVNNDSKVKADSATLYVVGVEESNNYSATVIAKMPDGDFDKAKYLPARNASDTKKLKDKQDEIMLDDNNQFNFVFEKKSAFGPEQPVNKITNKEVNVSFHSKTDDKWYDTTMMLDTKNMTFSIGKKTQDPQPPTPTPDPGENPSVQQNNGENSNVKNGNIDKNNKNVKTGDNETMLIYSMILMGTLISALYVAKRKNA